MKDLMYLSRMVDSCNDVIASEHPKNRARVSASDLREVCIKLALLKVEEELNCQKVKVNTEVTINIDKWEGIL